VGQTHRPCVAHQWRLRVNPAGTSRSSEPTGIGASYPLALVPAKVSCPNRQRSLGPGRGNASSCPRADIAGGTNPIRDPRVATVFWGAIRRPHNDSARGFKIALRLVSLWRDSVRPDTPPLPSCSPDRLGRLSVDADKCPSHVFRVTEADRLRNAFDRFDSRLYAASG
jgi:hypothetical protein